MYNRASADPEGNPWSERKRYIWWDAEKGRWVGYDNPDFTLNKPPDYKPPDKGSGDECLDGKSPFIMMADGKGWLYAPAGLKDGPLPTHYEPVESPLINRIYPAQQTNPAAKLFHRPDNLYHAPGDPAYPYVITTYRLTEHHTGGVMTRWLPWLAELQPHGFVEISPELAAEKGIQHGEWVTLTTARGEVEARAVVTDRMLPLSFDGRVIHQIGMPWHFGYKGIARGDVANTLTSIVEDPNSRIHEGKVFTCNIRAGRKEVRA
jgi:formate dehydrogenase major subunit